MVNQRLFPGLMLICILLMPSFLCGDDAPQPVLSGRRPATDSELRYWLENILDDHRFSIEEAAVALDLTVSEVEAARKRFPAATRNADSDGRLKVLPFPGGRHPRIGFLEGAVDPQRETKVSVFTPWQRDEGRADFVVVDVPEAIWSNLGLTYLAHTHVPTIWTKQRIELETLEWERRADGSLFLQRRLPNRIEFTSHVVPKKDSVDMTLTLKNGTDQTLTDLRVQNCVMLKDARGFESQTKDNKKFSAPYAAVVNESGDRWVMTAWVPNHRPWGNERCPCLHSDPKFPDCSPGETVVVKGRLWFYEGTEVDAEISRVDASGWWK